MYHVQNTSNSIRVSRETSIVVMTYPVQVVEELAVLAHHQLATEILQGLLNDSKDHRGVAFMGQNGGWRQVVGQHTIGYFSTRYEGQVIGFCGFFEVFDSLGLEVSDALALPENVDRIISMLYVVY